MTTAEAYEQVMLALGIWREARGEADAAKLGVGWVIRNRTRDKRWPPTVSGVLLYRKRPGVRRQFTAFDENDINATKLPDCTDSSWQACCRIVDSLMDGSASVDPTGGANHYHSLPIGMEPAWADPSKMTAQIGAFRFYKLD